MYIFNVVVEERKNCKISTFKDIPVPVDNSGVEFLVNSVVLHS